MVVSLNTMQLERSGQAETASGESSQERKQLGCDTEGTHSQGTTDPSSEPFKVLAVDDSAIYRKLVEHSLLGKEYEVLFAKNGRDALDLFAKHRPAVVVTDWNMPDIGGLELCRRIRQDFLDFHSHIILLTSNSDKEQVVEGLAAGADDYLTKPFHSGELVARIAVGRRIVELHREIQAKNRLLQEMALTDALTGLPNRRAVDVWAPRELSAAARHDFPFWAGMADLDFFKKVNDIYGHKAGDTALKIFAEILTTQTRGSDMCARLGGEEFLVMMTHADKEGAKSTVERIRKQFEGTKFAFGKHTMTATASFGIAGFRGTKEWSATEAYIMVTEELKKLKAAPTAIVASNDAIAGSAIQALEDKGWSGGVLVSGQDADLAAIERIFDGSQLMTVYKPVGNEARAAAEAAMKLARHEDVENWAKVPNGTLTTKAILLTPVCVTQGNAKQTVLEDGFQKLETVKQGLPKDKQAQLDQH